MEFLVLAGFSYLLGSNKTSTVAPYSFGVANNYHYNASDDNWREELKKGLKEKWKKSGLPYPEKDSEGNPN